MEIIKLNTKFEKFYKPWSKVESIPLPDGTEFITKDLIEDPSLTGSTEGLAEDIIGITDSETQLLPLPGLGEECLINVVYKTEVTDIESTLSPLVICRQTLNRTEHPVQDIPALFTFFRENADDLEWIPNELVELEWKRVYSGITYEVIQAHMTQESWVPTLTLGTLWQIPSDGSWALGTVYVVDDEVTYEGSTYKCLQSHTSQAGWTPPVVPALWEFIS